jgi:hypothetical protein
MLVGGAATLDFDAKRVDVAGDQGILTGIGVEVAVWTDMGAKRDVEIESKR